MSSMLFYVELKLQESRPLAMHTHAKESVNYTVCFTTSMRRYWKLFQINFHNDNLIMCFLSSTFRDRVKRHLSVTNKISTASCGNKKAGKINFKNYATHFITSALSSKRTDLEKTDLTE